MADPREPPADKGHLDAFLLSVVMALVGGFVASFTFFLRSRMGTRALALGFAGGACVQWLWAVYCPAPDLLLFSLAWMGMAVVQKIGTSRYLHAGGELHRMDSGYARVMGWIPLLGRNERLAKCVLEPGLVFLIGNGLAGPSPGMGRFFVWGSVAMLFKANIEWSLFAEKVASGRDAVIRARVLAQHIRQRR